MKGKQHLEIRNNKVVFKFTLERNITIIKGDSATGKTTLVNLINTYDRFGKSSGVTLRSDKRCFVLDNKSWKLILSNTDDSVVFIDEGESFILTREFADAVKNSDNYYVIITRENLYNLPISVDAIYSMRGRRYFSLKKTYNHLYKLYPVSNAKGNEFEEIITEDSGAGLEFFSNVAREMGMSCASSNGNSGLLPLVRQRESKACLLIADGAAFGAYMEMVDDYCREKNVCFYLPESFEWIILLSGIVNEPEVEKILSSPSDYIESSQYFSWERFFSALLTEVTQGTYLAYNKQKLNPAYLQDKIKYAILRCTPLAPESSNTGNITEEHDD